MERILIVDDETSMREFLEIFLRQEGYVVETASNGEEAIALAKNQEFDLVLTDLKMPKVTGIEVLERVKSLWANTQVIVMTAYSTAETAIEAMKKGAYDYISKPFKVDEIKVIIEKALEKRHLSLRVVQLQGALEEKYAFENIVGRSQRIQQVFELIRRVAKTKTSVLIVGESGTGKELVANALHYNSLRKDMPFVVINCGAIPENLMESELFGHMRGAFTGAIAAKKGLFEVANGGTIFLDEIGDLPLVLQVKLLRVLQERKIKPVGSTAEVDVDVRVIAATNKRLEEEIQRGTFREDLYYRLNVIQVRLPSLRERMEDVPLIAHHFCQKYAKELGKEITQIEPRAMDALMRYPFMGNVRELENIMERAVTFETTTMLTIDSLPRYVIDVEGIVQQTVDDLKILPPNGCDLDQILADLERALLYQALERTNGNKTDAAKLLRISFRSIRYKLDKYNISDADLLHFRGNN
ncbi:MAG: sigma-54-dependent Fis family transcriptional regulator [Myxococcales bacterium]|nr:sigma-54-dependent Fis family transcriptional regulator [Myxococcales bacterium]